MDRRLLKGGVWSVSAKVASLAVNALTLPLLARLLSPAEFGIYLVVASLMALLGSAGTLGLNVSLVRWIADRLASGREAEVPAVVQLSLGLGAAGATALALAVCGLIQISSIDLALELRSRGLATPLMAWLIAQSLVILIGDAFRGLHDIRGAVLLGGLAPNMLFAIAIVAAEFQGSSSLQTTMWLAAAAWTAITFIGLFWLLLRLRPLHGVTQQGPQPPSIRGLLSESLPLMVSTVVSSATLQMDVWVVGVWLVDEKGAVALYAAAARLVGLVATGLVVVNSVIPPFIVELYSQKRLPALERLLRGAATLAGIPSTLVLFIMMAAGESVLDLFYGPFYRAAAPVLAALSCGYLVFVAGGSAGIALMMTGNVRTIMAVNLFFCLAAFGATVLATPYGIFAVAIAMALSVGLQKLTLLAWTRHRVGVWTHMYLSANLKRLVGASRSV